MSMSALKIFFLAVIISTLAAGCTERRANKSQVKADKSQMELNDRKMEIADKYRKCVDKSSDEAGLAKCEAYRKEAEGL